MATLVLNPGQHLGPYEIGEPLGEGGMGAVFKARDTRLGRTVAIKVIKAEFSDRFDREARAISALSHPHICALYDVGVHDGAPYLVMEYLEGSELRPPLPLERALNYAAQIADALDAAHRSGIVHRDLKPANILITRRGVKLLDFGIVKFVERRFGGDPEITGTIDATGLNGFIGTPRYMAPEQVEGKLVDARSDIFSFGCVLYEMISGVKAFPGDSPAATAAAVLKSEPTPLHKLVPAVPAGVERTVHKCLAKDPDDRWQSARDLKDELEWLPVSSVSIAAKRGAFSLRKAALGLALVSLFALIVYKLLPASGPSLSEPYRFSVYPPHGARFTGSRATISAPEFAVSPDGRRLVYVAAAGENPPAIWLQQLDRVAPTLLPYTEDASNPFWSPDGISIGFFAQGKLKILNLSGGPARIVCDAGTDFRSGAWTSHGEILFSLSNQVVFRVPEAGGQPVAATAFGDKDAAVHRWPHLLPDEQHFLYFARSGNPQWRGLFAGSLADPSYKKQVAALGHNAIYSHGHLLYLDQGSLVAKRFDASEMALSGQPVLIAEQVQGSTNTRAAISASTNGILAYATASMSPSRPVWHGRDGSVISTIDPVADYVDIRLSPDGTQVAFTRQDGAGSEPDIWVHNFGRGTLSRLTTGHTLDASPIWSSDGGTIYFRSSRTGAQQVYRAELTDPSHPQDVGKLNFNDGQFWNIIPGDVSADGRWLVYTSASNAGSFDLWTIDMQNESKRAPYQSLASNEVDPIISPDGHFVAYASDETGRYEIYVQTFPKAGRRWQISSTGGTEPRWRKDGAELYYISAAKQIMRASVRLGPEVQPLTPVPLFSVRTPSPSVYRRSYDVTHDGKRFLVTTLEPNAAPPAIHVVLNWTALLDRK